MSGELPEAKVVKVEPGDVIVFEFPHRVPRDIAAKAHAQVQSAFLGNRVMILEAGTRLKVVREEKA